MAGGDKVKVKVFVVAMSVCLTMVRKPALGANIQSPGALLPPLPAEGKLHMFKSCAPAGRSDVQIWSMIVESLG